MSLSRHRSLPRKNSLWLSSTVKPLANPNLEFNGTDSTVKYRRMSLFAEDSCASNRCSNPMRAPTAASLKITLANPIRRFKSMSVDDKIHQSSPKRSPCHRIASRASQEKKLLFGAVLSREAASLGPRLDQLNCHATLKLLVKNSQSATRLLLTQDDTFATSSSQAEPLNLHSLTSQSLHEATSFHQRSSHLNASTAWCRAETSS